MSDMDPVGKEIFYGAGYSSHLTKRNSNVYRKGEIL